MNFGIYCSNENHFDLPRFMELDWKSTVILHGAAERTFSTVNPDGHQADTPHNIIHVARFGFNEPGWRVAPAHHDANILLRHYHGPGWQNRDPREWAIECAARAELYRAYTIYHVLLCEPNLHIECGWPASEQWRCRTGEHYNLIRQWYLECLREFKERVPWAKVGSPGLASGHSDDQADDPPGDGTIGLQIMRDMIRECDFFCHHDYWFEASQALSEWYGMRWTKAMNIVGWDMPLWVDECGWFNQNESNPDAGRVYNDYFASTNWSRVNLLGACIFIWDSDNAHTGQRIARNPGLVGALDEILRLPGPVPIPNPTPIPIVDYRQTLRDLGLVHPTKTFPVGSMDEVDAFVIHHVGAGDTGFPPTGVARYHVETFGWPGAGYTWFIGGDGTIYLMNDLEADSYQVSGHNYHTRGICLAGLLTVDDPTPEQIAALEWLLTYLEEQYPGRAILAHYELGNTACCGEAWFEPWRIAFLGNCEGPDIPFAIANLNDADAWLTDTKVALTTEIANISQVQVFVRDAKAALE